MQKFIEHFKTLKTDIKIMVLNNNFKKKQPLLGYHIMSHVFFFGDNVHFIHVKPMCIPFILSYRIYNEEFTISI